MRDYVEDYLKESNKPMSSTLRMVLKLAALGFVSAAVIDLLQTHLAIERRLAELVGILAGVLFQQIIPPRLSIGRLSLVVLLVCATMGVLFLLHW